MFKFPVYFNVRVFGIKVKITVTEKDFARFISEAFGEDVAVKVMAVLSAIQSGDIVEGTIDGA